MRTHFYKFILILVAIFSFGVNAAKASLIVYVDVTCKNNSSDHAPEGYNSNMYIHYYLPDGDKPSYYVQIQDSNKRVVNGRDVYRVILNQHTGYNDNLQWRWHVCRQDPGQAVGHIHLDTLYHKSNYYVVKGWQYDKKTKTGGVGHRTPGLVTGGHIYFDNSRTKWTGNIQFVIGHGSQMRTYKLTKVDNTELYYVNLTNELSKQNWGIHHSYYSFIANKDAWKDTLHIAPERVDRSVGFTENYRRKGELSDGTTYFMRPNWDGKQWSFEIRSGLQPKYTIYQRAMIRPTNGAYSAIEDGDDWPAKITILRVDSIVGATQATFSQSNLMQKNGNARALIAGEITHTYSNLNSAAYSFDGWGSEPSIKGVPTLTAPSTTNEGLTHYISENTTVCAFFTAKQFTVTLNPQGGSGGTTSVTPSYGYVMPTITEPTRTGYTFGGYWTVTNGNFDKQYYNQDGGAYDSKKWDKTANTTLYAKWTANKYTVKFNGNGNTSGSMADQSFTYDVAQNLTANAFSRTGYTFFRWNTNSSGTGTSYTNQQSVSNLKSNNNGEITLYAQWNAQTYKITYKDKGNANFSGIHGTNYPTTHTYDKVTKLVSPTQVGYTFEGWYTNPECTGDPITQLGAQDYTADITLYASWTFAMEYGVTGSAFITSANGQTVKATNTLTLQVSNMPIGTTVAISAPNITFYNQAGNAVTSLTTTSNPESFNLTVAYTPTADNTTEQPTITLDVLNHKKTFTNLISCRSLPATFAIVTKVGNTWYALPSQGLNSKDALVGYPVEVDSPNDPTVVTNLPANADWSLRQVYVGQERDRFKQNGANIVLVNNEATAQALNASSSDNYLLTNVEYESYHNTTNPALYEWTPTTTDLETYTLTNAQRTDRTLNVSINNIFGVHYDNKATTEVRFLPIAQEANRYTPLALQVVEWKENSVVIMYNGNPEQTTSVSVNGAAPQETVLSSAQRDIAVYELAANGLAANPTQRLSITIGTEKVILSIPYIISGEKTDLALLPGATVAARQEVAKVSDLVILKDATLTAAGAKGNPYKFRNVTVYGGGKLVVPAENGFGVNSLTLRIGGVTADGNYDYVYPEFVLNTNTKDAYTNTSGKINLDYVTTKEQYYTFVAPFKVYTKEIKYPVDIYGSNVKAANRGSFEFQYYDGEARANGEKGWKVVAEDPTDGATLTAHKGYTFYGMPEKVSVNGGTSTRQKFGIHRIPMTETAANVMSHENSEQPTKVSAYPSQYNINAGWNLIGNPYMSTITGLNNNSIQTGTIVLVDDRWQWSDQGTQANRFIVFPSNDGEWYYTSQASNATLPAFKNFFVQIETGNSLAIPRNTAAAQLLAPTRRTAEEIEHDIEMAIVLEKDEAHSDQMDFLLNDAYNAGFDYNADFTKMMNATNLNLYGVLSDNSLSFVALDHITARSSVAIGYQVPEAGEYTLRISDKPYVMLDKIEALYVTDHEMSPAVTTNLMEEDYVFHVHKAEINDTRFTISLVAKTNNNSGDVTTDLGELDIPHELPQKFLYNGRLYILRKGKVYTATGHEIKTINE